MRLLLLSIVILLGVVEIYSWRIFHLGRQVGGNLGLPQNSHRVKDNVGVIEEYFTQKLDHSEPTDNRTWQQRFYTNDAYYNGTGPAFLMIGGEGEASVQWMTQGAWVDSGERFGALLFQLEHRYYGKSYPTEDMSTENLKYLTSEQALSDLAAFIVGMNQKYNLTSNVKWIAFGGSYSGSLAAWLRFKYPHLVHGAMSASGPLLAESDFKDYFEVVTESLATYSDDCPTKVREGFEQIDSMIGSESNQTLLNSIFNLCDPIEDSISNDNDISNFYETIAGNFAGVVQYNKDNRIGHPAGSNITIDIICEIMVNEDLGEPIERLGQVNKLLLTTYDESCLDFKYDKMIDEMKNVSWDSSASEGGRQWMYQTCTEFGFYQTSSQNQQYFSSKFPLDFFVEQCTDIFGDNYNLNLLNKSIDRTNTNYGALNIEVDRVVFVHGSIDPWHALGVTKTVNPNAPAIYINGTAHCANMYPKSDDDPPQLTAAREEVVELIGSWLELPSFNETLMTPEVVQIKK